MNKVAAIQMISGPQVQANLDQARTLLEQAADQGARLALLPECFAAMGAADLVGIGAAEFDGSGPIRPFLAAQARRLGLWIIAGSMPLPREAGGKAFASCLVFDDQGRECARYDKLHLFDVEVPDGTRTYRESNDYSAGDRVVCIDTPVGRVGLSICYDLRFAELYLTLRRQGADLLVVPSAFTAVTGAAHWEVLLRARAIETQCYVLAADQGGRHPNGRETFGHSCLVDPWGEIRATLDSGQGVICETLDLNRLRHIREQMPVAEHRRFAPSDALAASPRSHE
jgi:deaminated glutathione amidase